MRASFFVVAAAAFAVGNAACPGPVQEGQYPPRPEGCDVKVFHGTVPAMTDNIGPVMARCSEDISEDDCMRTLKDQACKLGADVVWGVSDVPSKAQGKKQVTGRAAHSKTPAK